VSAATTIADVDMPNATRKSAARTAVCMYRVFPPLFAEDRIPDQGRNHQSNLDPELSAMPEVIWADHRVLKTRLDVDRNIADLDRLCSEEPDGNVPFVARLGLIVVSDRRIHPDLPGIRQVEYEKIEHASLIDVGGILILAAASDFPEIVREGPGSDEFVLVSIETDSSSQLCLLAALSSLMSSAVYQAKSATF
jgi:hypothetical protein